MVEDGKSCPSVVTLTRGQAGLPVLHWLIALRLIRTAVAGLPLLHLFAASAAPFDVLLTADTGVVVIVDGGNPSVCEGTRGCGGEDPAV